jgi:nucleoside-diphosphate-sugar epimerase
MFKTAVATGEIIINNPSIWRPILSISDAANAYVRAIEAAGPISGIFNIASGNYTVGEVADFVKDAVEKKMKKKVKLNIKNIQDFRNYKVSVEKAMNILSFKPGHTVESILDDLIENFDKFKDFENPNYYNIQVFKKLI